MSAYPPAAAEIRKLIMTAGPMPVSRYMELCLTHPQYGYYMTRDPLGREGDFTTAPEVSQMFGELLGLWAAAVWKSMGMPNPVRLIEFGPGRGTMMADVLRAIRVLPSFYQAVSVASGRDQSGADRPAEGDVARREAGRELAQQARRRRPKGRRSCWRTSISTRCRCIR